MQGREGKRFAWPVRPNACKENMICGEKYRMTILTSRLIRLEYVPSGKFEDRASQTAFYRDFPICQFDVKDVDGWIEIETEHLNLRYMANSPFTKENLSIRLKMEPASVWNFGADFEDLGGTTKTLDEVDGARPLDRGVCSRNGFSVLDDSNTLLLGEDGWIECREKDTVDCYFFGYGFDYIAAVQDLYRLTGEPPMLPAYALGNWWSRYHAYTQQEYLDLMDRFRSEDIPFTVSVVDMDWHITEIPEDLQDEDPGFQNGWTGYTWNEELFPDYKKFLRELKERNMKVTLNLHPHQGVRRHEVMYKEMAKACGIDPTSGKRVPIDVLSQDYMEKYFDIIHHPYEEDGVDFWWMDWQQGTNYWWIHEPNDANNLQDEREQLDPLWMLNHLHILDISRNGKRPMFFSRYSGPGSHRYPVGFSGDSFVTWDSLEFQPYFTATASNVGYSWWSHDIGGHQHGWRDDEMFVRWVQYGVFSPINRLHSSCNDFQRKEPWSYGKEAEAITKEYLRLRHALFPYIYTMNYRTHKDLLPLVQPMYYSHPKCGSAYDVPNQYWFGSELIVCPITEKRNANSNHGSANAWLPSGDWFDFQKGLHYYSVGRKFKTYRTLEEMPVYAKAGAIVPMETRKANDNHLGGSDNMKVMVFPGASNKFVMYEDSGDYDDYQDGAFVTTDMKFHWGDEAEFVIEAAQGDLTLIPQKRKWDIGLRGFAKNIQTKVFVDDVLAEVEVTYDRECNTTIVSVEASTTSVIRVNIQGEALIHDNSDVIERCMNVLQMSQINIGTKTSIGEAIVVPNQSLHQKLYAFMGRSEESQPIVGVLRELLSLTEEEY